MAKAAEPLTTFEWTSRWLRLLFAAAGTSCRNPNPCLQPHLLEAVFPTKTGTSTSPGKHNHCPASFSYMQFRQRKKYYHGRLWIK